ncbi:hypothetical protein, partial [Ralstonia pseudosolanacearum]|uniref:hypothetical protein n=1 Tax=Ralstonia pseudosolanacearum TaxID=1310165 RepID=UPI001FFAB8FB
RQTTGGNLPVRPLQWSQLKPTSLLESRGGSGCVVAQQALKLGIQNVGIVYSWNLMLLIVEF